MSKAVFQECALVDWAAAVRPIPGEIVSGDMHLVTPFDHGVLLAAVDGIGHGEAAAAAAEAALAILAEHAHEPVVSLFERCHKALAQSRGVVMTVASLHALKGTLTWLGVGNVEGRLFHAAAGSTHRSESVLLRSGMVGYQLPELHASITPVAPGDLLIFATDGVGNKFADEVNLNEPPKQLASRILDQHFKGTDDALVLVARYLGMQHE